MQEIYVGEVQKVFTYLVDETDGYTPETGVAAPTIYLTKNGAAAAVPSDGTWAEISAANMPGWYSVQLDATDLNTVGLLGMNVIKAGVSRHFPEVIRIMPRPMGYGK